jgi:acetamidase/formamidase
LHPGRFQTFGNEFEQAFHRRVADLRVTDQFLEFAANPVKIQNLQPWRGRTERDRSSNGRVGQKRRSLPGNFAARRSLGIRASPLGYTVCNPRSNMRSICIVLFAFTVSASHLGAQTGRTFHLGSTPQTVYRGFFPRNAPPALTVPSGSIVDIDTLSHQGLNLYKNCTPAKGDLSAGHCALSGELDPLAFQAQQGIPAAEVLSDATDVFYKLDYETRSKVGGAHVLTGPIYVDGAEPGDTLEVRVLKIKARVPWGYNAQGGYNPQGPVGALPGYLKEGTRKLIRTRGDVALFGPGIEIPLKPFQGTMAVAPADDYVSPIPQEAQLGFVGSRPPGPMGGNMDVNDFGEGTSIYFPVFQKGAQFFTGDPHQVQANGEVSGTALEQSNAVTMQFIVHKKGGLTIPRAETPTHYILIGISTDHNKAIEQALRNALDFLQAEKGLSAADAMAFASLAVDINIAESVDYTNVVMARIPKAFFKNAKRDFWHAPLKTRNEIQRQGLEPSPSNRAANR